MTDFQELDDLLGSILNRSLVAKHLIKQIAQKDNKHMLAWLPTLLEDNHADSQTIIDIYCIKEE